MNEATTNALAPLLRLQDEATRIASEHGFTKLSFAIVPLGDDGLPHVQLVVEWDPDKESVPDTIILQAAQALQEQAEARHQEQLEQDVAKAAEQLRRQVTDNTKEAKLDPNKIRQSGQGFL